MLTLTVAQDDGALSHVSEVATGRTGMHHPTGTGAVFGPHQVQHLSAEQSAWSVWFLQPVSTAGGTAGPANSSTTVDSRAYFGCGMASATPAIAATAATRSPCNIFEFEGLESPRGRARRKKNVPAYLTARGQCSTFLASADDVSVNLPQPGAQRAILPSPAAPNSSNTALLTAATFL